MKKLLKYFLIFILFVVWGVILTNKDQTRQVVQEAKVAVQKELKIDQPCSKPLEFSIGTIDPKFGISQDQFMQLAESAASV